MKKRRRPPSAAMSLFSYLDGLVCTMGALILLLLLTAHKIREQVLADHVPSPIHAPEAEVIEPLPPAGPSEDDLAKRQKQIARLEEEHRKNVAMFEAETEARHAEWNKKLASLGNLTKQLASDVENSRQRVASTTVTARKLADDAASLTAQKSMSSELVGQIKQSEEDFKQLAEELLRQREESLKKLEAAKVHKALRNPVFEIVAQDSNSGTTRRPILIECTSDSVVFCSEGIRISAATLNEFTAAHNPLLAGTEALMTHWKQIDGPPQAGKPGPYVLMIVRPGGTVGFYVARSFLEKLGADFGYELVSANSEFKWPAADPQAVDVCQKAIDNVLNGPRPQGGLAGSGMGGSGGRSGSGSTGRSEGSLGRPGSDRIVGENGEFSLAEVDQLRNSRPADSINMLGPEWSNPKQRRLGISNGIPNGGANGGGASGTLRDIENEMRSGANMGPPDMNRPGGVGEESEPPLISEIPGSPPGLPSAMQPNGNAGGATENRQLQEQPFSNQNMSEGRQGSSITQTPSWTPTRALPQGNSSSGRPSSLPSSQSPSSQFNDKQLPPPPLAEIPQSARKWKSDGGAQKKWGQGQSNGAIGIERNVILALKADRFEIVDGPHVGIPIEMTRHEFQDLVAALIDAHARTWGSPPSNYFWRPTFEVHIHPGGNVHYPQLKELFEYWGLNSKIEFVKSP